MDPAGNLTELLRAWHAGDRPAFDVLLPQVYDLLALDRALDELAALDARKARVVEGRFFAGPSIDETARALEVSPRTVPNEWTFARTWLHRALEGDPRHVH